MNYQASGVIQQLTQLIRALESINTPICNSSLQSDITKLKKQVDELIDQKFRPQAVPLQVYDLNKGDDL